MEEQQDARFWQKVDKTSRHWHWIGAKNEDGYGQVARMGRAWGAHRYAWVLATGETLTRLDAICHTCDDPACVRNDDVGTYRVGNMVYERRGHLFKATQVINVEDRDAKERGHWATGDAHGTHTRPETVPRGEQHPHAKLTNAQVAQIKASYTGRYGEISALARRFGVTPQAVWSVTANEGWAHVEAGEAIDPSELHAAPKARGERHSQAKLTESEVIEIRTRYAAGGVTQYALAADYGVCVPTINNIVKRKIWTHIP